MTDQRAYCCASFAGKPEERLSQKLFEMTGEWYAANPIAVGCDAQSIKHHQRACQDAVRAAYTEHQEEIHQACGFFEPLTVISIILTIIRLFYDWTHRAP